MPQRGCGVVLEDRLDLLELIEVGWFRQSGSGKSFTELVSTIEREGDPDRWVDCYALGDKLKPRVGTKAAR